MIVVVVVIECVVEVSNALLSTDSAFVLVAVVDGPDNVSSALLRTDKAFNVVETTATIDVDGVSCVGKVFSALLNTEYAFIEVRLLVDVDSYE